MRRTLGVLDGEELGDIDKLSTLTTDLEGEGLVWDTVVVCLGSVNWRLDFDTDVKGFWQVSKLPPSC